MKELTIQTYLAALILTSICLGQTSTALAQKLSIDSSHSSILFRVMHKNAAPFYGRFNKVSGSFSIADNPAESTFEVSIKADSIDTNNKKRDAHLKSPDFFNAREFPTVSFKSTSVKPGEEGRLKVTGDLTCHGVTKSIIVDMELTGSTTSPGGDVSKGVEAIFNIKRSEYGIMYGLGALGDDVRVIVALEGVLQK